MDIETFLNSSLDGTRFDYAIVNGALAAEHDIKTAVLISLFTDRRAEADDVLPNPGGPLRGWWGDAFRDRRIGSRLWLLGREKQLREVLIRAQEYAQEALEWLVGEGIAKAVKVFAYIVAPGILGLDVAVERESAGQSKFKFEFAWNGAQGVTR